jgi:hypothetical protein
MKRLAAVMVLFAGLLFGLNAEAGVYKCATPGGGMEYRSTPCPTGHAETIMAVKASARSLQLTSNTPKMMIPSARTGRCSEDYWMLDGVCVHSTQLRDDPKAMNSAIGRFKQAEADRVAREAAQQEVVAEAETNLNDEYCRRYRSRLTKYEQDGVTGVDLSTGQTVKKTGAEAKRAVDEMRARVDLFCK